MAEPTPPAECANCGTKIPPRAKACPECGADEHTGWREGSVYDGLDLPDPAFDDEPASPQPSRQVNGLAWYWWMAAICLILLFLSSFISR